MPKHPIQPIEKDEHGTYRFKPNAIVQYLLDKGPFDLNHLAMKAATTPFSQEDREQFAQLINDARSQAQGAKQSSPSSNEQPQPSQQSRGDSRKRERRP